MCSPPRPKYEADVHDVYSLLCTTFANTEAEGIVKLYRTTRDAKTTWAAIKVHFEATSFKNILKADALNIIRSSKYTGPKKNFNLSSLYQKHVEAHNILEEAGLPFSEQQKIQEFQQSLQEATAIEKSVDAINIAGINSTFEAFFNSLNGTISTIITLSKPKATSDRFVNQLDSENGRGGRGGRGRGRGSGRGRGRGRGRSNRYHPYQGSTNRPWSPRLGPYTDEEWYALSYEQKQRVWDLRNAQSDINQKHGTETNSSQQINNTSSDQAPLPPAAHHNPYPSNSSSAVRGSRGAVGAAFRDNKHRQDHN